MRTIQTFVVRILHHDDFGSELHGQISEPASADEWRASFANVQELFDQMLARLAADPAFTNDSRPQVDIIRENKNQ